MLFSKEIQVNNFTSLDEEILSMYGAKPETINENINMNSVLLTQIININSNYENILIMLYLYKTCSFFNNKNTSIKAITQHLE